jgi:hypothetical protein
MARRRRQEDRPTGPFAEFVAGLGAGAGVIGVEMVLFVFIKLQEAFTSATEAIAPPSFPLASYFSFITLVLFFTGIVEYFIIGSIDSSAFSIGFLIGDTMMLFFTASILWTLSPSIVTGMIIALVTVLVGLFIKSLKGSNGPQYGDW